MVNESAPPRRRRSAIYHQEEAASQSTNVPQDATRPMTPVKTATPTTPVTNAPVNAETTGTQQGRPVFQKREDASELQTTSAVSDGAEGLGGTRSAPPIRNLRSESSVPTPGIPRPDGQRVTLPEVRQPQNVVRRPVNLEGMEEIKTPAQRREEARQRANLTIQQQDTAQRRLHLQQEMVNNQIPEDTQAANGSGAGKMVLTGLICLLLALGLFVIVLLVIPEDSDGAMGQFKQSIMPPIRSLMGTNDSKQEVPTASGFTATLNSTTAPYQITFNLVTSSNVTAVRVADENGNPMEVVTKLNIPNADDTIVWLFELTLNDPYEGVVEAQMLCGDGWVNSGLKQTLSVGGSAPASISSVPTSYTTATNAPLPTEHDSLTADSHEEPTVSTAIGEDAEMTENPEAQAEPTSTLVIETLAETTETPTMAPVVTEEPEATEALTVQVTLSPTEIPTATPEPTTVPTEEPVNEEDTDPLLTGEETNPETTDEPVVENGEESGEPEASATEKPTEAPTATPTPVLVFEADESADPSLIANTVVYEGDSRTATENYQRSGKQINMPAGNDYMPRTFGVLTYRGNAFRQNAAVGTVENAEQLSLVWTVEGGSIKGKSRTYYGFGWANQPLIVQWSSTVRRDMTLLEGKNDKTAMKEVIAAGLDGKIYFLDLEDGSKTREVINLGYPIRSTPSLSTLGYPQMTVGQYARFLANKTGNIGWHFYNLLDSSETLTIDGLDGGSKKIRAYNDVGAFDTSALYDCNSDTFITAGTNGMLYTVRMNTSYELGDKGSKLVSSPEITLMKSRTKNQKDTYTAVEASIAMYGGYAFYADVQGVLRCVDVNTMTTIWAVETGDAVKASIALDQDSDGQLWLYTANTLLNRSKGDVTIRRYNAQTGAEDWSLALGATKKSDTTAGAMASPVVGQYGLNDLVYFTLSNLSATGSETLMGSGAKAQSGILVALNKNTGKVVWTQSLGAYCYSSPVAVYNSEGKGWIIQATSDGLLMLLDGLTGETVNTLQLNGTIESSPAVYNNMLVICTTGKNTSFIYAVKIE